MEFVATYRSELTWVVCGALLGALLAPLHGLVTGPFMAGCMFAYKWTGLIRECFRRFRRFMICQEVQDAPVGKRWWKLSEALLTTPMIELSVQKENQDGLGRLAYKVIDAWHAWFFVFVPETGTYGWRASVNYKDDLRSKWGSTFGRVWFVVRTFWSFVLTVGYMVIYGLLFAYELVETVCLGWGGVLVALVSVNYYLLEGEGVVGYGAVLIGWWPALLSGVVVLTGCVSHVCRWLAYSRPSPMDKLGDLCEQWKETMEDRAQLERLALAFWKEDGGTGPPPRDAVEALRAARAERMAWQDARAEHRELWKQIRASGEAEEAAAGAPRRGRRASVGEDVPSGIGPHRSTRVKYRPRSNCEGNQMFETWPAERAWAEQ